MEVERVEARNAEMKVLLGARKKHVQGVQGMHYWDGTESAMSVRRRQRGCLACWLKQQPPRGEGKQDEGHDTEAED